MTRILVSDNILTSKSFGGWGQERIQKFFEGGGLKFFYKRENLGRKGGVFEIFSLKTLANLKFFAKRGGGLNPKTPP